MNPRDVSIIIPTLQEESQIAAAIESAVAAGAGEIVVSDGGSTDATVQIARSSGASKIVRSLPGRGTQQNSGAAVATRDWLLFLHADNRLDSDCLNQLCQVSDATWGGFRQRIDSPRMVYRAIQAGNATRARWLGRVFGDQGLFVRTDVFRREGGFDEIPLMEDVELSSRLRRIAKPRLLDGPITISPRRWEQSGVVRQTLRNWSIQIAYATGTPPRKLATRYR